MDSSFEDSEPGVPCDTDQSPQSSKYFESDGEIGYRKGQTFIPVTNFYLRCKGYVAKDEKEKKAEGFLIEVVPKDTVRSTEDEVEDAAGQEIRETYFLTWKDMSQQSTILSVISSTKLWTLPLKEQFLPTYMKELCDYYAASTNARRVFPVQGIGLQKSCDPPTWVFGSDVQIEMREDKAKLLAVAESRFHNIGSENNVLPWYNFRGSLDAGEALIKLIDVQKRYMGKNFASALFVLGGVGLAVHFEQLTSLYDGIPIIMAYGEPVTGKSTAVRCAMAVIGQDEKIGECTLTGAMELISQQTIPFWWDDAADFSILEKLSVAAFNRSSKKKKQSKKEKEQPKQINAKTVPVVTMNPSAIAKSAKKDPEKLHRVFSRIAVIPFEKLVPKKGSLKKSLAMQTELKAALENVMKSIGVIIELRSAFQQAAGDETYTECLEVIEESHGIDSRSESNFSLLLFSTIKIAEKLGMKEELFPLLKKHMLEVVLPNHKEMLGGCVGKNEGSSKCADNLHEDDGKAIILQIVKKASENPEKAKMFFNPEFQPRICGCGLSFGFHVPSAIQFIGLEKINGNKVRSFINLHRVGCTSIRVRGHARQYVGVHVKRSFLDEQLKQQLDSVKNMFDFMVGDTTVENISNEVDTETSAHALTQLPEGQNNMPVMPTQLPEGQNNMPVMPTQLPEGQNNMPVVPTQLPEGQNNMPVMPTQLPEGQNNMPVMPTQLPEAQNNMPVVPTQLPEGQNNMPVMPTQLPEGQNNMPVVPTQLPEGQNNMPVVPTQLPEGQNNMPVMPTQLPEGQNNMPVVPTQLPEGQNNMPVMPTQLPEAQYNMPVVPTQLPEGQNNMPVMPTQLPEGQNNMPVVPTQQPEGQNNMPVMPTQLPEAQNNMPVVPTQLPEGQNNMPVMPTQLPEGQNNMPVVPTQLPEGQNNMPVVPTQLPEGQNNNSKPNTKPKKRRRQADFLQDSLSKNETVECERRSKKQFQSH